MKKHLLTSLLAAGLLFAAGSHAGAADHVSASHGWIRVLPGGLPAGAYVTLKNDGDEPVLLRGATSTVYAEVMLHQSSRAGGMSRMTTVESMSIPAHGEAALAPAGYHLMLMKPGHPVQPGETVTLNLEFTDGSTLSTAFIARPANAIDGGAEHAGHGMEPMDHGTMDHAADEHAGH